MNNSWTYFNNLKPSTLWGLLIAAMLLIGVLNSYSYDRNTIILQVTYYKTSEGVCHAKLVDTRKGYSTDHPIPCLSVADTKEFNP